jgi:glucose-1-phosphate cytidylyltransferase
MRAVLLAGGLGTRLSEETDLKPKPLVEIGGRPILWHIMKIYSTHGVNDFIICCGYKGYLIKEYFANYFLHMSDVTFDMQNNQMQIHRKRTEPWSVTLVDTGDNTLTGGRLRRVSEYLKNEEDFCFTYGDGVSDVNITELIKYHKSHGKLSTLTAVRPPGRYGALKLDSMDMVNEFQEKTEGERSWINGGFFVLSPKTLDLIENDNVSWEGHPLTTLAKQNQLASFKHDGFWQPMDTLRDKTLLNDLWLKGKAPWKTW